MNTFFQEPWFQQLDEDHKVQVQLSFDLFERENVLQSNLADYSFIIFPAAKAYEGFLKSYFLKLGLINEQMYRGTRFRIGRALNPDIRGSQKDESWIYDDVEQWCGTSIARQLWEAWLECRNRVFHFYPERNQTISLKKSELYLIQLTEAMKAAVECKIANT